MGIIRRTVRRFRHPNGKESVEGRRVLPGEQLRETDVYPDQATKTWRRIHALLVGDTVQKDTDTVFIRPI